MVWLSDFQIKPLYPSEIRSNNWGQININLVDQINVDLTPII